MTKTSRPFGLWESDISGEFVAGKALRFGQVQATTIGVYWSESRPTEQGRSVVMRHGIDGKRVDVIPQGYSAHSRVHEYGGAPFLADGEDVFFVNETDQDVYHVKDGAPLRLTQIPDTRFADSHTPKGRHIFSV